MTPSDPTRGSPTGTHTPGPTGTSTTNTGRSGVDTARDTARDLGRDASHEASRLANQAREGAREGMERARSEASRQANRGIERSADEVSRTSHALETAASEFESGSLQHQLFHRAADGLSELSETLRGRSIDQIAGDLASFGRRNPAAFLGGAALVGFAVARFARASRSHGGDNYGYAGAQGSYGGGAGMMGAADPDSAHAGWHDWRADPSRGRSGCNRHDDSRRRLQRSGFGSEACDRLGGWRIDGLDGVLVQRRLYSRKFEAVRHRLGPVEQGEAQCLIRERPCTNLIEWAIRTTTGLRPRSSAT